ncbi:MAG: nuclear transport factor 2 family protein [Gammaproteobacteria bacterium]|nr:nuclear transport factor 2 family protein [Gammaproteobacteria bacterium]
MIGFIRRRRALRADAADTNRRSFFLKLGAGASAALASTVGLAKPATGDEGNEAARLKEEQALRKLHQSFEQALDEGRYDDVVDFFGDDAEVLFEKQRFSGRADGISRLFREQFAAGKSGARMEQAPGFEIAAEQRQDRVEVAPGLAAASAVFPYSIRVGKPLKSGSSLVSMAQLHGEGIRSWWEGGVYRVSYTKSADGGWQIARLEYDTLSRADYRSGRSYARPWGSDPQA